MPKNKNKIENYHLPDGIHEKKFEKNNFSTKKLKSEFL